MKLWLRRYSPFFGRRRLDPAFQVRRWREAAGDLIASENEKGEPSRTPPRRNYLAYSTALVSRTTVTRIWPGKLSSDSIRLAISRAMS